MYHVRNVFEQDVKNPNDSTLVPGFGRASPMARADFLGFRTVKNTNDSTLEPGFGRAIPMTNQAFVLCWSAGRAPYAGAVWFFRLSSHAGVLDVKSPTLSPGWLQRCRSVPWRQGV